ncbi:Ktr system potassium transporter B [Macrococcus brunensis]|uniref:Ktr system potassium transporter B n=1 Tax=Macrococcus brunensis TaxID=198483 RepID=A0A4V3BD54_9STAP|nr:Ktr system potassium transporter B [Macrococcus brunensis]
MIRKKSNPYTIILLSFLVTLCIGTLLLALPIAQKHPVPIIDHFFIATSAFTVTGLATIDITADYTYFGLTVIMLLIQVGGLGIVTLGMVIFILIGRKVGLKNRFLITEALNQTSIGGIMRLVKFVLIISLGFEFAGTLLLALEWIPEYGFWNGLYRSLFTSISAFNNAGFALHSDNMMSHRTNPVINFIVTSLIIMGGLGFTVYIDLIKKKSFHALRVHTKIMLIGTICVNFFATALIFLLEMHNQKTIGGYHWFDQLQMSYFQAVTTRTAGFNSIDIGAMNTDSLLIMMLLMFIGGGSTSVAGGIKLTTAAMVIFGTISYIRGQEEINIFERAIEMKFLLRSFAIVVLSSTLIFIITFLLVQVEHDLPFLPLFFEVVSAFGTVGLTMGVTAKLSVAGKLLIILMMMIGKIGVLTIVFTFSKPKKQLYHYPKQDILTG